MEIIKIKLLISEILKYINIIIIQQPSIITGHLQKHSKTSNIQSLIKEILFYFINSQLTRGLFTQGKPGQMVLNN